MPEPDGAGPADFPPLRYNRRVTDPRSPEKAEIAAIHEVAKILTSTQNLDRALGTALRTLQSFLGFDRTAVFRPDETTREIRMEVAAGYTAEQRERGRYVWGEGIVGKTMKTGSPIALPDVRHDHPTARSVRRARPE